MNLYAHQVEGIEFLKRHRAAMLYDDMGLGKTRQALIAAHQLFRAGKIDRVLVLAPAVVYISWKDEISKFLDEEQINLVTYYPSDQSFYAVPPRVDGMPVLIVSYALLPQKRHAITLEKWAASGKTLLVCDESSFLKNRAAKQTKASAKIAASCEYRWLLTGTPIANSPLDLYGQSLVMSNGSRGPLSAFKSFYHFRARYAVLKLMNIGQVRFQQVVGYQNIPELTKRFAPYVLRRTKEECLDLPEKTFIVREVSLSNGTWAIYKELKKEALLALPNEDVKPEPNAAVRLLKLCQLTSGQENPPFANDLQRDVSSEKLDWLVEQLLDGELSNDEAVVVWSRWRRESERLQAMLASKLEVYRIFGGQNSANRSADVQGFQTSTKRRTMISQVHAGGYGLTLTAASTAVYLSNSFSHIDRVQSEDRIHRIGQKRPCLYVDVLATGPRGERTVDHFVLATLQEKRSLADTTCAAWRRALE